MITIKNFGTISRHILFFTLLIPAANATGQAQRNSTGKLSIAAISGKSEPKNSEKLKADGRAFAVVPNHARSSKGPVVDGASDNIPAPHRFWDAQNIVNFGVSGVVMSMDLVSTRRALEQPGAREANPLMRNSAAAVGLKVGAVALGVGLAYACHRSGHHRVERVMPLILAAPSGVAAIHNWRIQ